MKRFILILLIFLAASLLKSQTLTINDTSPLVFSDSLEYMVFDYQYKQKSSQRRDLKTRIKEIPHLKVKVIGLAIIGTWMYCFRDDLQAWSRDNDKAAHLFLSYGLSKFFGWKFALGFMLSIEATQSDIFGTEGRYEDTIEDLFVDFVGIGFSLKL